jgi:hypothetical protein
MVRQLARARIRAGEIAPVASVHIFGGRGSGQQCSLCGAEIPQDGLEYEVDIAAEATYHLHIACYSAWYTECANGTS